MSVFVRLPEKYPTPLLFSMPPNPPPIIIKQDRKKFLLMIESKI